MSPTDADVWLQKLAERDASLRQSLSPVSAHDVTDLSMVEMQARLVAAAEGNSLRDAIIRSQSARISELTEQLSTGKSPGVGAGRSLKTAVKSAADRSPAPVRNAAYSIAHRVNVMKHRLGRKP